jgi:hypothetical protein
MFGNEVQSVDMARTGRRPGEVILAEVEREQRERWSRRAKSSQALAQRCKIVLGCADGLSNAGGCRSGA